MAGNTWRKEFWQRKLKELRLLIEMDLFNVYFPASVEMWKK